MKQKHKVLILMIEDDENSHQLYRDVFERNGFEVIIHENADGFFPEQVSNIAPDIISMDLMLWKDDGSTERDGFEAIESLKADPRTSHIPVIVLTNFFEEKKVRRAKEIGAVDYINIAGQAIKKIPLYFLRYLKDPKHFKPSHPLFRG